MKRGLGKGLASLLSDSMPKTEYSKESGVIEMDINLLESGKYQPRKNFDLTALEELSDSIRQNGIIQPIIVHAMGDKYAIIAGERRWRAAHMAGLDVVPVIMNELSDEKILEISLVENIQREDLNVIEEAEGYLRLVEDFGYTQDKIAKMIGKSRSHIANVLRLNSLPQLIKDEVRDGRITMGHARSLVGHDAAEEIAKIILEKALNVRQTELLVKNWYKNNESGVVKVTKVEMYDDDLGALVEALSEQFGMKIAIENDHMGSGKVIFYFSSLEQLDSILTKLT